MSYSTSYDDEFCRECGETVTWTGDNWIHDNEPLDGHNPTVPYDPYDDEI